MQRPQGEIITIENIVITEELDRRNSRAANLLKENQALQALARHLVNQPQTMLQSLVDIALELCSAGTVGVSLLEVTANGEEIFRWNVLAGALAKYVGGTTPRNFSPCGVCLERGTPQLYSYPERYFTYLQAANTPIVEGLVLPLIADNHALGTIWIMLHCEQRHFDSEDVRVMTSLADLAAAALLLNQRQTQELLAKNAQLEVEAAECQRAKKLAQESEAYFWAMIENLPGGAAFVVDRNLRYLIAGGEALHTAGFKSEDLVGKSIFEALPPELAANHEVNYRIALTGEPFEHEHNAHNRSYISRGTPLRAEDGEIYAVLVVSYDITARKRAEDDRKQVEFALRESEAFRRLAVESGRMGTWRWDCRSRQCWGDAGFLSLWGVPPSNEKLPVSVFTSRLSPEGAAALEAVMTKDIAPGEEFDGQLEVVAGANAGRWIRWRGQAERETPWIINGVSFDVTEQKRAEVALRESQARLQSIANLVPDLLWDSEPSGSTNWYNQRWMEYTGQTFEQAIGWGWIDAIHPDDRQGSARRYREAVEQGIPLLQEHRIRRHDGAYRWFVVKASPLKDESGKTIKMYGAATDIHEQRVALEALRESEAKYRSLFNAMDEGYMLSEVIFDENDKPIDILYLEANPAAIRLAGRDFSGQRMREIDPNYEEYWYEIYGRIALAGEAVRAERYAEPHGRWFDFYAFKVGEWENRRVATVFQDITDRKRAEVALRESEERLRDVLNSMAEGFALLGGDFTILDVNEETLRLDGRSRDELIGRTHWDAFPGTEDSSVAEIFRRVVRERTSASLEHAYHWPDGRSLWLDMRAYPTQNDGVAIFWRDITDRKQTEAALSESEAKYRSLFNSLDEAFAVVEVMTGENGEWNDFLFLEVNPAFVKQTGMEYPVGRKATELLGTPNPRWAEIYGQVAETGEPIRFEEGEATLGRVFDLYVFRLGGEGSRRVAVLFTDITDRKHAEAQLRRAAEKDAFRVKLADALRSLSDAVEIQATVTRTTMNFFGADRCYYCEIIDGSAIIRRDASQVDLPSVVGAYPLENSPIFKTMIDAGQPFIVEDAHTTNLLDENLRQTCLQLQIISFINVPAIKQGEPVGILCVTQTTPRSWTEFEMDLAEEIADRTWATIERVRAEAALRESEAKYRSLFESINDGFALLEVLYDDDDRPVDCRFLEVSPSFEVQTGLPQAQGKTLRELIPSVESVWFEDYHQALVTNTLVHFERRQHYLKTWFEVDVLPSGNPQERQVAIVFRNINERKQAEAERLQLIREQAAREQERQRAESLAELDRAKTLFFSNVSHEFRTPLTLILAPLSDALSDSVNLLPPAQQERLELAHRNSLRLLKLVNTLLDFSRIEAGRMEAVYQLTDLALYTTQLASVFRSAIERAGLQLIVDCPPLAESVYVDREMWEKIVLNLLSNAFKFTLEGEIKVRLHLADDRYVKLHIEDTGTGIEPEELPHLFKRFYQVKKTTARTHEGSGIGLALVHELIEMHGGTIEVNSTPRVGSCFTVTIPLGTAHLSSERIQATRTLESTALSAVPYVQEAERWITEEGEREKGKGEKDFSSPSPLPLTLSPSHILIVDDNADMRDYLTRILSDRVEVQAVADGAAALAAVNERSPDLVLSDVMMPGLDGFELLKALRTDPRTKEVPIILLSARAGEESVIEGLLAGADDYLIKPFSATELVTRVNAYLQLAHLRSETLHQERTINRRKDEVLSVVSHELNTPLVAILGWTRLLQSNPPSPAMLSKALETIERNATLQAKLVEDLLDISRIAAGKICLNLEPVQLQGVIESAIATVQQSLQTKNIHLDCQLAVSPLIVQGDSERLQQIILNLLTNAVKFTPNGGKITVSLQTHPRQAEITVTDTGCGIDGEFLPHIFETFRQAQSTKKGLGLGLAIARSLVELHSGTIAAHSPGIAQGTTFTVKLPLI
ncbi:two-component hybrid sensor and regulator [Nostoc linckia NIES-25]|nr:two-component hybrid sensor and regulator [Nostoc linckia NIES-25]